MNVMPLKNLTEKFFICNINFGGLILKSFIFPVILSQLLYMLCHFSSPSSPPLLYVKGSSANTAQSIGRPSHYIMPMFSTRFAKSMSARNESRVASCIRTDNDEVNWWF